MVYKELIEDESSLPSNTHAPDPTPIDQAEETEREKLLAKMERKARHMYCDEGFYLYYSPVTKCV